MAHYAYHVGQMVYIGKQLKDTKWESLSITKGKSQEYLKVMFEKNKIDRHRFGSLQRDYITLKLQSCRIRNKRNYY